MAGRPKRRARFEALRHALEHGPEAARQEYPDAFRETDYERMKEGERRDQEIRAKRHARGMAPDGPESC